MSAVYFGGSRNLPITQGNYCLVAAILQKSGIISVHVGCQHGADHLVAQVAASFSSISLHVFTVAPSIPPHLVGSVSAYAAFHHSAGGESAPMRARYLLRSIAAFQGCSAAVFFCPGKGSLAVAREAVKAAIPVFAFQQEQPAPVPATAGSWVKSQFFGFFCWQFKPAAIPLF